MNYMIYGKPKEDKRFYPLDVRAGRQVDRLLYATLFHKPSRAQEVAAKLNELVPTWTFQARPVRVRSAAVS
jgi:hypothetical protein